jgi:hypothetical protein
MVAFRLKAPNTGSTMARQTKRIVEHILGRAIVPAGNVVLPESSQPERQLNVHP